MILLPVVVGMSSSDALDSLLVLCREAERQGAALSVLAGSSSDGAALQTTLAQMAACVQLVAAQRERVLFETPSAARSREQIAHLTVLLARSELALARARHEPRLARVDFVPGLAYNLRAGHAPVGTAQLVQKLELIQTSESTFAAAPPASKLEKMRERSHDVLRALSAFLPYLAVAPERSSVPLLSNLSAQISQQSRELAEMCEKSEKKLILDALEKFEGEAGAFVASVRDVDGPLDSLQAKECAKSASVLVSVITPKCVLDLVKGASTSNATAAFEISSTE
jgi:hypothetical protein